MRLQLRIGYFHRVERYREVGIGRVEINDIVDAAFRNPLQYALSVVAVRIDDGEAVRAIDVRYSQKFQHTGLTDTGLTNDIQVSAPVFAMDAEHSVMAAEIGDRNRAYLRLGLISNQRQIGRRLGSLGIGPENIRRLDVGVRQVEQTGDFFDIANKCPLVEFT